MYLAIHTRCIDKFTLTVVSLDISSFSLFLTAVLLCSSHLEHDIEGCGFDKDVLYFLVMEFFL